MDFNHGIFTIRSLLCNHEFQYKYMYIVTFVLWLWRVCEIFQTTIPPSLVRMKIRSVIKQQQQNTQYRVVFIRDFVDFFFKLITNYIVCTYNAGKIN